MVFLSIPTRVLRRRESLHRRILPQLLHLTKGVRATPGEMHPCTPAWQRNLPGRPRFNFRNRRPPPTHLVPESLPPLQTLPRPQNTLLRRRSIPLLLHVHARRTRLPPCRLLQQREGVR